MFVLSFHRLLGHVSIHACKSRTRFHQLGLGGVCARGSILAAPPLDEGSVCIQKLKRGCLK